MDDLRFFAWLDGELDAAEAREVEAAVAASPELQGRATAHRTLRTRLNEAFDPIAASPLPANLPAAATRGEVVNFGAEREIRRGTRPTPIWAQWGALAATLALGLFVGSTISPDSPPMVRKDGQLVVSARLEKALDERLASSPVADSPRIGLTFRDASGRFCRSFSDQMSSGLACRDGGDWRIRGLFQAPEGQGGEFRMAAGQDPQLAQLIASTMAGEPLDAAAERQAMERDWR